MRLLPWVGLSRFELKLKRPKCFVLPLHHSPILSFRFPKSGAKIRRFWKYPKKSPILLYNNQIIILFAFLNQQILVVQ